MGRTTPRRSSARRVNASVIEIWTDVNGVLSADPRAVPSAFVLPQITYEEAMELSYFGAKVLHSAAIAPAVAKSIPLLIKNTFKPSAPGTLISRKGGADDHPAKGITSIADLRLITLRGLEHGRRAGRRGAVVPRAGVEARQRDPDLAGLVRAHDLLRGQQRATPTRR